MFFNKPALEAASDSGGGVVINWHQDGNPNGGGWGLTIDPVVTIWTALDLTTRANGCLQVLCSSRCPAIASGGHGWHFRGCVLGMTALFPWVHCLLLWPC